MQFGGFRAFVMLYNHHLYLVLEGVGHPRRGARRPSALVLSPQLPVRFLSHTDSVPVNRGPLCLASLMFSRVIHLVALVLHSFHGWGIILLRYGLAVL